MNPSGPEPQVKLVAPSSVTVDRKVNTRPVDAAWVARKRRAGYDMKRVGVPTISARENGELIWLDGQNRGALIAAVGKSDEKIYMRVFHGLTVADEAELFLGLNDNRRVTPIYKFLAEVTAGRAEALEISKIANAHKWTISDSGSTSIHAVSALRTIYRSSTPNGSTLRQALYIVTQAWGRMPEAVHAHVLMGLASVINAAPEMNPDYLAKKLAAHDGGPLGVLNKGRGYRTVVGCTVAQGVDQVIRSIYNTGRRSGRLSTWGPPAARTASQTAPTLPV
ncbi:DUF6551 family protein [Streptomyces griseus]|uniref:DUF6551 family protein n=1 Tax=Streptomyces griseus TaxID=1911 RepID=UPI00341C5380